MTIGSLPGLFGGDPPAALLRWVNLGGTFREVLAVTSSFLKRDPHGRASEMQWPHFMKFHTSSKDNTQQTTKNRLFVGVR